MRALECLKSLTKADTIATVLTRVLVSVCRPLKTFRTIGSARISIGIRTRSVLVYQRLIVTCRRSSTRVDRIASLTIEARQRVIALLKTLIALGSGFLCRVVAENIEEPDDSLLSG